MTFSFVLPAYKGRYLSESIDSILAQDYKDFELIIVDDCSPDHLDEIVAKYNDSRISYYKNEKNIGGKDLVAQWNHCLEYATGDYVILATDDDLYESTFLSTFVPLIKKYPDANLLRARILSVNSQNKIMWIDKCYKEYLTEVEFRYHMMHGMKGGIPHYIFKRCALVEKGGFVNFPFAWGSDDATAMMMAEKGVVNSQQHLVRFRWSDINISSDNSSATEKFKARLKLGHWLSDHPVTINTTGEWKQFYEEQVTDYVPIYRKLLLLQALRVKSFSKKVRCIFLLWNDDSISTADKMSVLYRLFCH